MQRSGDPILRSANLVGFVDRDSNRAHIVDLKSMFCLQHGHKDSWAGPSSFRIDNNSVMVFSGQPYNPINSGEVDITWSWKVVTRALGVGIPNHYSANSRCQHVE